MGTEFAASPTIPPRLCFYASKSDSACTSQITLEMSFPQSLSLVSFSVRRYFQKPRPCSRPSALLARALHQVKLFIGHRNVSKAPSKSAKANLETEGWSQMEKLGEHAWRTELAWASRQFITNPMSGCNQTRRWQRAHGKFYLHSSL